MFYYYHLIRIITYISIKMKMSSSKNVNDILQNLLLLKLNLKLNYLEQMETRHDENLKIFKNDMEIALPSNIYS